MSNFSQDFSNAHLRAQYRLIDGHVVEVGKIDLQELYNSMLPNSLDSILKAFLEPSSVSVDDTVADGSYQSMDDLIDTVNLYAEAHNLGDLSFSEVLMIMVNEGKVQHSGSDVPVADSPDVPGADISVGDKNV